MDRGGPAIREYLEDVLSSPWQRCGRAWCPTNLPAGVRRHCRRLADQEGCCLIITTGGTGPACATSRRRPPKSVCQKMMPGFGELMRQVSLQKVPTAILSRQTAGIRGRCLIVNLPGQPRAIGECLDAVFPAIPYCIDLIGGPYLTTHEPRLVAFRPQKK